MFLCLCLKTECVHNEWKVWGVLVTLWMKRKSTKELGTLKMSRPRKKKEMTVSKRTKSMAILTNELPLSYPRNHVSNGNLHNRQIQVSLQYSRDQLKRFRRHVIIDTTLIAVLKDNDIFRYRGKRSGKQVKELQDLRSQRRWENLNCLNRSHLHSDVNNARAFSSRPCIHPKASIPSLLISNTRSLTCKQCWHHLCKRVLAY